MGKKKQKYYTVWSGKAPGIYESWDDCEAQVKGVEGAKYKSFATREDAEKALSQSPTDYITVAKAGKQKKEKVAEGELSNIWTLPEGQRPVYPSLAVDGACSGNPGKMEYRGVDTASKQEIFHFGPAKGGTNNIGEFLAIVHALALMQQWAAKRPKEKEQWLRMPIYSDSKTALAWVRKRQCGTKLQVTDTNRELFDLIRRAENWLLTHSYQNTLLKWDTDRWGEIPADFGRK